MTNSTIFAKLLPMLAVIKTGGKQYVVQPGDKVTIEKLDLEEGKDVTFAEILLWEKDGKITIGTPFIKGAEVKGKVLAQTKGKKLIIFKYKPKKRYKRKIGHRQKHTQVEIVSIS